MGWTILNRTGPYHSVEARLLVLRELVSQFGRRASVHFQKSDLSCRHSFCNKHYFILNHVCYLGFSNNVLTESNNNPKQKNTPLVDLFLDINLIYLHPKFLFLSFFSSRVLIESVWMSNPSAHCWHVCIGLSPVIPIEAVAASSTFLLPVPTPLNILGACQVTNRWKSQHPAFSVDIMYSSLTKNMFLPHTEPQVGLMCWFFSIVISPQSWG